MGIRFGLFLKHSKNIPQMTNSIVISCAFLYTSLLNNKLSLENLFLTNLTIIIPYQKSTDVLRELK